MLAKVKKIKTAQSPNKMAAKAKEKEVKPSPKKMKKGAY